VKHSSLYLMGNLARRAAGFFMIPFYAHYLNPAEYGTIELIELFINIVVIMVGLQALGEAMVRIYYEYAENERSSVISTAILSASAVSLAITIVGCAVAGPLSRLLFHSGENTNLICAAFVSMFFASILEASLVYQRMLNRAAFFVGFSLIHMAANIGLNVYFIAFLGLGVWGFVLSKLVVSIVGAIPLLWIIGREAGWRWRRAVAMRVASFGLPLVLTGAAYFVIHFSDRFFLNAYCSLADVGVYALAYRFGFLVTYFVGEPFSRAWDVNLFANLSEQGWEKMCARVARYFFFFLFLTGLALAISGGEMLKIAADPSFYRAAAIIPMIVLGYVAREAGDFFRLLLYVNKRTGLVSQIALVCAALNAGLNFALVRQFGMAGAAWATLLTWTAYLALCWTAAHREHRIPFPLPAFLLLGGVAGAVYALSLHLPQSVAVWQWVQNGLLAALFVVLVWLLRYFPAHERRAISGYVNGLLAKLPSSP